MKNKYLDKEIWLGPKFLRHKELIQSIINNEDPKPIHISLDIIDICNHECIFCWNHGKLRKNLGIKTNICTSRIFDGKRLLTLIDELKSKGTRAITFTGSGESLLHPNINDILEKLKDKNIDFGITTNLSVDLDDRLLNNLLNASWLRCSFNASNKKLYNSIHNPKNKDSFNNVINNLKSLVNKDVYINISFVVCKENKHDIVNITKLSKKLKVNSISFRPDVAIERENITYDKQTLKRLQIAKEEETNEFTVNIGLERQDECKTLKEDLLCYYSRYTAYIDMDGFVYPCCMLGNFKEKAVGNILNTKFDEFWELYKYNYKKLNMRYCPLCRHYNDNKILNLLCNESKLKNNFV